MNLFPMSWCHRWHLVFSQQLMQLDPPVQGALRGQFERGARRCGCLQGFLDAGGQVGALGALHGPGDLGDILGFTEKRAVKARNLMAFTIEAIEKRGFGPGNGWDIQIEPLKVGTSEKLADRNREHPRSGKSAGKIQIQSLVLKRTGVFEFSHQAIDLDSTDHPWNPVYVKNLKLSSHWGPYGWYWIWSADEMLNTFKMWPWVKALVPGEPKNRWCWCWLFICGIISFNPSPCLLHHLTHISIYHPDDDPHCFWAG